MKTTLWKSMKSGLKSGIGDMTWTVGKWEKYPDKLEMCESGFHASVRAIDAMRYVGCEILALVEVKGNHLEQHDKQVWESMRIVKAYEWKKKDSVAMAIFCAELVIGIYEKKYPDDNRPRKAIEAAKAWLENPTKKNRHAAAASAAVAVAAAADAHAAYARAHATASAAAVASAADAAAYAASAVASSAAHAASAAKKETLDKVESWTMERISTLMEAKP